MPTVPSVRDYQVLSTFCCMIVMAASRAWLAVAIASPTSSAAGPGDDSILQGDMAAPARGSEPLLGEEAGSALAQGVVGELVGAGKVA